MNQAPTSPETYGSGAGGPAMQQQRKEEATSHEAATSSIFVPSIVAPGEEEESLRPSLWRTEVTSFRTNSIKCGGERTLSPAFVAQGY